MNGKKIVSAIVYLFDKLILFFFSLAVIVGGIDMMTQSLMLAKKPHIVIGKANEWDITDIEEIVL